MAPHKKQLPFVIFKIKESICAVPSMCVREILILPKVVPIPNAPADVRGVINLRGKVTKLVDLRVRFGLPPAKQEVDDLIQLLMDREQDHKNWLNELERCVRERQPFTLCRDPHGCKFGLWYDHFKTGDTLLRMVLKRMNEPHVAIHASADQILRKAESGDNAGALALLDARKQGELALLIKQFEEARELLREPQRELAVVLSRDTEHFALTIDEVEAVEHIPDDNIGRIPTIMAGLECRIAQRHKTNETVLLLEESFLFPPDKALAG